MNALFSAYICIDLQEQDGYEMGFEVNVMVMKWDLF